MQEHPIPGQSVFARVFSSLRFTLVYLGLLSLLINMLMLTGPLFMLQVYDRVLASYSLPTLVVIGLLVLCLYLFFGLLEGLRSRILNRIGLWIDARLSVLAYEVSTRAPLLLGTKANQLRPMQDMDTLRQFICGAGPAAIMDMPWLPFYLAIVFLFHPWLGLVALAGAVVICVLIAANEYISRRPVASHARDTTQRMLVVEAARRNAEVIQAMGMLPVLQSRWQSLNEQYLEQQCVTSDRAGLFGTAIKTFRFMLQSLILAVGAWLAIKQEVTPGVMIAASIMSSRALSPVEQAVSQWRGFVAARQSLHRLKQALDTRPDSTKMTLPLPCGGLELQQFCCAPAGMRQAFVQNISLALAPGDGLGIIGPSGSGKSTLARGIVGVLPTLKGSVRLDGADISQWHSEQVGDFIGYLPQDIQLFAGTIADNISRFALEPAADDIIKAATMAGIHQLVVTFPEGYNTRIDSGGLSLSGGQRQRIALARALYKMPFLVVLDEPNSNLDSEGEQALTEAVTAIRAAGSIVIVIAHRPSAIAAVDTLLCMQNGKTAALGPKQEVMQRMIMPVRETA